MGDQIVPALRFKDQNGQDYPDWEIKSIGELGETYNGLNGKTKEDFGSGHPFITYKQIFDSSAIDSNRFDYVMISDGEKQNKVQNGDIFFTTSSETRLEVGFTSVLLDSIENLYLNSFCFGYRVYEKHIYLTSFFRFYFRSPSIRFKIARLGQGSTRYNLSKNELKKIIFRIPSTSEQQKIADFLSSVDKKIEQLTRKKELLEKYKTGMMQKLFPKAGEQHPELRFKDENGQDYPDWVTGRLDVFVRDFIVPMRDKPKDLNGIVPWCRLEDFDGNYIKRSRSNQGVSWETIKKMNLKLMPVNSVIVSCSAYLGKCAIVKSEIITNQTFIGLVPDEEKLDFQFLFYLMKKSKNLLNRLSSGTTISYLSRSEFESLSFFFPSLSEQQKIADFLSAIDDKITKIEGKLTKAQTFKKGLLQQMFV